MAYNLMVINTFINTSCCLAFKYSCMILIDDRKDFLCKHTKIAIKKFLMVSREPMFVSPSQDQSRKHFPTW